MSLLAVLALADAHAANCDAMIAKAGSLAAADVPAAYAAVAKCDKKIAEANFNKYLEKATDSDAAVALFITAIESETWTPVWGSLSKITSYEARDEVANAVGAACADKPKVVSFLQGAYFGLRDIEFQQWDDAYRACPDAGLVAWMEQQVSAPPNKMFDEKFNALVDIYVKSRKADALPALSTGAIKAAGEGGPYDAILMKMGEAVAPDLGQQVSVENQKKLEEAMIGVAKAVPAEKARGVAEQLANSGSDAAAAQLLPTLYPDRVQGGGGFLYGAIAVEAGECDGKKSAVLHYASVTEGGKRWSILNAVEGPLRGTKAKLGKCSAVESPWPIITSPEPLKSAGDVDKWVQTVQAEWEKKGYSVKAQKEKAVAL